MTFPTTAILDTANRANEGPPPSASWSDDPAEDGIKIVTLRLAIDGVSSGVAWWDTQYGKNCEVYVTISTLPADGQSVYLYARYDSQDVDGLGYKLEYSREIATPPDVFTLSSDAPTILTVEQNLEAGGGIGLQIIGDSLSIWYATAAGVWTVIGNITDTEHQSGGYIGLAMDGVAPRALDFGGGAIIPASTGEQPRSID